MHKAVLLIMLAAACGLHTSAQAWNGAPLCAQQSDPFSGQSADTGGVCELPGAQEPPFVGPPPIHPWSEPVSIEEARRALREAQDAIEGDRADEALLMLRIVAHAMPRIADRIALLRGDALRKLGNPKAACRAYGEAERSLDRTIAATARLGSVYCRLEAGRRDGETQLQALLRRYPNLTERYELSFAQAQAREGWGNRWGAASIYRQIDLLQPYTSLAGRARQALDRLRAEGIGIRPLSPTEQVERAERMVKRGSPEQGHAAVESLHQLKLSSPLRARVHVLAARLARVEGRWDDVSQQLAKARRLGVPVPDAGKLMPPPPRASDEETGRRMAERRIAAIKRRRPMRKLSNMQLRAVLQIAGQAELKEPANEAVAAMAVRKSMVGSARFEAAMLGAGLVDDEKIAKLLKPIINIPRYRVSGRYHYARALERMGRGGEAEAHYLTVRDGDRSATRYYAMWAEQRMWALYNERSQSCVPRATALAKKHDDGRMVTPAWLGEVLPSGPGEPKVGRPLMSKKRKSVPRNIGERRLAIKRILKPIAEVHGEAYPWLPRALDLVELGRFMEAADELNESYLAWRDARGSPRLRSGLEAVFRGGAPPRRRASFAERRARLRLDGATRKRLSRAAELIGDPGIALRFGTWKLGQRPRAYADAVEAAARKHGLDPNLLFAVMRVESIYNRRIVSYAGAMGLMQIMPRTGTLIAQSMGVQDFEVTDLLEPELNVEFSAWYLSSLLSRFDGRLPLAIASYNGGPHNVRLWMRGNNPDIPLDAFLERIPFSQTHRYVRRVLTHYAAYRAQQKLPMVRLDVELPEAKPDPIAF